jgi:hypothetical protein
MRYFLLGYLRRCVYLAHRLASQHPAQFVLLNIAERSEIRR